MIPSSSLLSLGAIGRFIYRDVEYYHTFITCHCEVVSISLAYSGVPGFHIWPGDWLTWLKGFGLFLCPSTQILA
jgi:hypothetical protein